ncbi:MAG: META domain-containing protein, partial [Accumulibacter sp.]|uniref:META domain-containing protein n=1 Tax=Accumulibacter sp. TaxID=2053492 RepID=UPI002FC3AC71
QGQVHGSSGCNTYRAAYTSEGNRLAIGPVVSTRKACSAEGVMGRWLSSMFSLSP